MRGQAFFSACAVEGFGWYNGTRAEVVRCTSTMTVGLAHEGVTMERLFVLFSYTLFDCMIFFL